MKTILAALLAVALVAPAGAVTIDGAGLIRGSSQKAQIINLAPGQFNGIRFSGEQPNRFGNSRLMHFQPDFAVGPLPVFAGQNPAGSGAPGLPPLLAYLCVFLGDVGPCKAPAIDTSTGSGGSGGGQPPSPIPLPASLPLLLGGLFGLGFLRRVRRRA